MIYFASGGLKIGGRADIDVKYQYLAQFFVGSILYDIRRAKIGILDKIAIKRIRIANEDGIIIYVDTFNRSWNEGDLCSHGNAVQLATQYWTNQIVELQEQLQ